MASLQVLSLPLPVDQVKAPSQRSARNSHREAYPNVVPQLSARGENGSTGSAPETRVASPEMLSLKIPVGQVSLSAPSQLSQRSGRKSHREGYPSTVPQLSARGENGSAGAAGVVPLPTVLPEAPDKGGQTGEEGEKKEKKKHTDGSPKKKKKDGGKKEGEKKEKKPKAAALDATAAMADQAGASGVDDDEAAQAEALLKEVFTFRDDTPDDQPAPAASRGAGAPASSSDAGVPAATVSSVRRSGSGNTDTDTSDTEAASSDR